MLRFFKKHRLEIGVTILAYLVLNYVTGDYFAYHVIIKGAVNNIAIVLLAILFGFIVKVIELKNVILIIIKHTIDIEDVLKKPITEFLVKTLDKIIRNKKKVLAESGLRMSKKELNDFASSCFENNPELYIGTDSHVPSDFYKFYAGYLELQRKKRCTKRDTRIILASKDDLEKDFKEHFDLFDDFCHTHLSGSIPLLQVNPSKAKEFAQAHDLPSTDIGIFNWEYVVFYSSIDSDNNFYTIWMSKLEKGLRDRIRQYLYMLNRNATEMVIIGDDVFFREKKEDATLRYDERLCTGNNK